MLSMNVVAANPASPSGAGFAGTHPAVRPAWDRPGRGPRPLRARHRCLRLPSISSCWGNGCRRERLRRRRAASNERSLNGRRARRAARMERRTETARGSPAVPAPRVVRGPGQSRPGPSIAAARLGALAGRAGWSGAAGGEITSTKRKSLVPIRSAIRDPADRSGGQMSEPGRPGPALVRARLVAPLALALGRVGAGGPRGDGLGLRLGLRYRGGLATGLGRPWRLIPSARCSRIAAADGQGSARPLLHAFGTPLGQRPVSRYATAPSQ